jgi:hypothetical protein
MRFRQAIHSIVFTKARLSARFWKIGKMPPIVSAQFWKEIRRKRKIQVLSRVNAGCLSFRIDSNVKQLVEIGCGARDGRETRTVPLGGRGRLQGGGNVQVGEYRRQVHARSLLRGRHAAP